MFLKNTLQNHKEESRTPTLFEDKSNLFWIFGKRCKNIYFGFHPSFYPNIPQYGSLRMAAMIASAFSPFMVSSSNPFSGGFSALIGWILLCSAKLSFFGVTGVEDLLLLLLGLFGVTKPLLLFCCTFKAFLRAFGSGLFPRGADFPRTLWLGAAMIDEVSGPKPSSTKLP